MSNRHTTNCERSRRGNMYDEGSNSNKKYDGSERKRNSGHSAREEKYSRREKTRNDRSYAKEQKYMGRNKRANSPSRMPRRNRYDESKSPPLEKRYSDKRQRERSRSGDPLYRNKHSKHASRDRSISSEERDSSRKDKDRRSDKRNSKESRWGEKEKEWKDPLLPKSNAVYKDTLKGMLELLQQDADIKKQKELALNPEKAQALKEQVGKMEKSVMKKPSENRPGDWRCTKIECGNINFAWRKACNNCDTEKPENAPVYQEDESDHENSEWLVGAIKTEPQNGKNGDRRINREPSPRALDEQCSSEDEISRYKTRSRKLERDHRERSREKRGRDHIRKDRSRSRSRERERDSHRREKHRSSHRR